MNVQASVHASMHVTVDKSFSERLLAAAIAALARQMYPTLACSAYELGFQECLFSPPTPMLIHCPSFLSS